MARKEAAFEDLFALCRCKLEMEPLLLYDGMLIELSFQSSADKTTIYQIVVVINVIRNLSISWFSNPKTCQIVATRD